LPHPGSNRLFDSSKLATSHSTALFFFIRIPPVSLI
jgi:hypothetical protein